MQLSLLYLLLLVHLVVDFMQPAALVAWSKYSSWGLVVHSSIYMVLSCLVLVFAPIWWIWALVLGVSHFILDKIKVILHDLTPRAGLLIFIVDQVIHISIITLIFFLALAESKPLPKILDFLDYPSALLYAVGYIAVTFGGSILIFEIASSLRPGSSKAVISMGERYQGIMERAIALTLILLGRLSALFPIMAPLVFVPSLMKGRRLWKSKDERKQFMLEFITSVGLAFSVGIIFLFLA